MSIIHSNVAFDDFVITRSELTLIYPEGSSSDAQSVHELFADYLVDVDFGFRKEEGRVFAFVKTSINRGNSPLHGYQIFCEGMGVVRPLKENAASNKHKSNIEESALFFTINQVRAFIFNLTTYGVYGKYLLPAIDLNAVLRNKKKRSQSNRPRTRSGTSKTGEE